MEIVIGRRLTYGRFKRLARHFYEESLREPKECWFDWTRTQWALLPDIVSVLLWSSKLVNLNKAVNWVFLDPNARHSERTNTRETVQVQRILDPREFRSLTQQIDDLRESGVKGNLFPGQLEARIRDLRNSAAAHRSVAVATWVELETASLHCLPLHGYLQRYEILACATNAGIKLHACIDIQDRTTEERNAAEIPKTRMAKEDTGPCLALRSIPGIPEVDELVSDLCKPDVLTEILGEYARLEISERGALARILVAETGRNVSEHSGAAAAWVCTRLVDDPDTLKSWAANDPVLQPFLQTRIGFVEVIVADDGHGLATGLEEVLQRDPRDPVRRKYTKQADGHYPEEQVVDYAFDRLSSTKRDILQLIHAKETDEAESDALASGLYWVWNVVRSHRGVLSVRTGRTCLWHDFTCVSAGAQSWDTLSFRVDRQQAGPVAFAGTMIRLCFPVASGTLPGQVDARLAASQASNLDRDRDKGDAIDRQFETKVAWLGDFGRVAGPTPTRGKPDGSGGAKQSSAVPPSDLEFLQSLLKQHETLGDGGILLLDLCGMREQWQKGRFALLCRFFMEMNYTATGGRSAVVLWNVPESAEEPIRIGLEIVGKRYSQTRDVRRAVIWVRDNGRMHFYCGWPDEEDFLGQLPYDPELDIEAQLRYARWAKLDRNRLLRLLRDNSHLFDVTESNCVALRAHPLDLRQAAWREAQRWLQSLLGRDFHQDGVQLCHPHPHGFYRLPSTGYLVKRFYAFAGQVANHESCARLSWMLGTLVRAVEEHTGKRANSVISVTRSTTALLRDEDLRGILGRTPIRLAAATIEELAREAQDREIRGPAVLVTDVISSGTLCERVARALPNVEWLGTAAILDVRPNGTNGQSGFKLEADTICNRSKELGTGPVYALALRDERKFDPAKVPCPEVTAIDPVTRPTPTASASAGAKSSAGHRRETRSCRRVSSRSACR